MHNAHWTKFSACLIITTSCSCRALSKAMSVIMYKAHLSEFLYLWEYLSGFLYLWEYLSELCLTFVSHKFLIIKRSKWGSRALSFSRTYLLCHRWVGRSVYSQVCIRICSSSWCCQVRIFGVHYLKGSGIVRHCSQRSAGSVFDFVCTRHAGLHVYVWYHVQHYEMCMIIRNAPKQLALATTGACACLPRRANKTQLTQPSWQCGRWDGTEFGENMWVTVWNGREVVEVGACIGCMWVSFHADQTEDAEMLKRAASEVKIRPLDQAANDICKVQLAGLSVGGFFGLYLLVLAAAGKELPCRWPGLWKSGRVPYHTRGGCGSRLIFVSYVVSE